MRIGEVTSRYETSFDPQCVLLFGEIKFESLKSRKGKVFEVARVRVKSPKINRTGNGDLLTVYEMKNEDGSSSNICPIKALKKYRMMRMRKGMAEDGDPAFVQENGRCWSGTRVNAVLSLAFSGIVEEGETVSAHPYRGGLVRHLQEWNFSAEEIQGQGRWSSSAYELYCRLPETRRLAIAERLALSCR